MVSKLLHGEAVHIGLVGSTISSAQGGDKSSSWFSLFTSWLQATFPAVRISSRNRAVPGARSEYISACLDQLVDAKSDLVFVEVGEAYDPDGWVLGSFVGVVHNVACGCGVVLWWW